MIFFFNVLSPCKPLTNSLASVSAMDFLVDSILSLFQSPRGFKKWIKCACVVVRQTAQGHFVTILRAACCLNCQVEKCLSFSLCEAHGTSQAAHWDPFSSSLLLLFRASEALTKLASFVCAKLLFFLTLRGFMGKLLYRSVIYLATEKIISFHSFQI